MKIKDLLDLEFSFELIKLLKYQSDRAKNYYLQ